MKRYLSLVALSVTVAGCGQSEPVQPLTQTASAVQPEVAPQPGPTYEQLLSAAEEFVKQKNGNEAVKSLSQAIALNPDRTEAFLRRSAICSEANLLAQAIADMTSVIRIDPNNPKYLNTRGYFLLLSKQYDRAESDFSDAIGMDLQYAQPFNNRGLIWVAQGKYEQAIKDFDNALKANPDYLDAHNNRGFALLQLEKFEPAIDSFSRVIEKDPKYLNAITNRARAYLKLNRPSESIADYTRAIEIQPEHQQHYLSRAEAYTACENPAAANRDLEHVEWLQELNELNLRVVRTPRDAEVWSARGHHLLQTERFDEAKHSFQNALTLVPNHPRSLLGRAKLAVEEGNFDAAISDCSEILKREASYETSSLRGDAYFALGKFGDAIADYETARRFDERVVEAYRQRAAQMRTNGDEQLAQADEKFAEGLAQRLSEGLAPQEKASPREMVIEQASYEEAAPQKPARELK